MAPSKTDIISRVTELSSESFEAFCEDISGMFGVSMESTEQPGGDQTVADIKKQFKKLSAVITVNSEGILDGDFYIVFDKEALFTLAGTIVMLPEKRIGDIRKTGTSKEAEDLHDAVGETGNLLVGSWDRIFREEMEEHGHFLQTGTFIGNPWTDPKETIGLSDDEKFLYLPYQVTVGEFGSVNCGVIFPPALFETGAVAVESEPAETPEAESETETPAEERQTEVAEVPAAADEPTAPEPPKTPAAEPVEESPAAEETAPETTAEPVPTEAAASEVVDNSDREDPDASSDVSERPQAQQAPSGAVSQAIKEMVQSLPAENVQGLLNVCAQDVMQTNVLWGGPDDTVQQGMEKMQQADVSYMLIGDAGKPDGIVTWIDLAEAVSIYLRPVFGKWRRPADDATLQIRLKVIMTRPVRTIKPQTSLAVMMEEMSQRRLRCLPVVDEQGKVAGVVTAFDIFSFLLKTSAAASTAAI